MDQTIFDGAASSAARLNFKEKVDYSEIIELLKEQYENTIIDDNVWDDLIKAAKQLMVILNEMLENMGGKSAIFGNMNNDHFKFTFLRNFQYYCMNYNLDGKKRSRFFSGMIFMKSEKNPNRIENFLTRAREYHQMALDRTAPNEDNKEYIYY